MTKQVRFITHQHPKKGFDAITNLMRDMYAADTDKKGLRITVDIDAETRRDKANRLLWVWNGELAKHIFDSTGETFSSEDIHEWIVDKLLPKRPIVLNREPVIVRTRTSKLSVKEFAEFLAHYELFADETYHCKFTRPQDLYIEAIMRSAE